MRNILMIARKEFAGFFSSPIAFIFLGTFLAVTLFIFFWVETFFSRNIADVRPLFEWMPVLMIFLVSAITMRMWAEERRSGTLEFLMTSPVRPVYFVLGKFLACIGLVGIALAMTLPLPITVSLLGNLDWGPVIGGYIATICLAAAYSAIGLFVSSRSENQIVSLILTVVVCGIFYLVGSNALTDLVGQRVSEFLELLGTGSRFDSITRGVIDFRDLYYYISLVGLFLTLNVLVLEWLRWSGNPRNKTHTRWALITGLVAVNFLAANVWLTPVGWARADLTQGNMYSISDATKDYLSRLREPLLIRGYFSEQTHPLLAPLVPQMRDLMKEYSVVGGDRVRVEVIDPAEHPELEKEAAQKYNIKPVPFQVASKYKASVVNSYFDVLIKYGDEYEHLNFQDLIEFKAQDASTGEINLELRNPEYDMTQAIKKVLYSYQASGQLFSNIDQPVQFNGYISPDGLLPEQLVEFRSTLNELLGEYSDRGGEKFKTNIVDPAAGNGQLAQRLTEEHGFRPMTVSLFDQRQFWFYMTLESGDRVVPISLPDDLNKAGLKNNIDAALKRFSGGFMKTIALHTPPPPEMPNPRMRMMQGQQQPGKQFNWLRQNLEQEHGLVDAELTDGQVPAEADLLLLASPKDLSDKQLFAVDQFLMQGGTVIAATSAFDAKAQRGLSAQRHSSGLEEWLSHHGINIEKEMVLDTQNTAFPVPVQRQVNGYTIQERRMVDYPYFVDIRGDGFNRDAGLTSGLEQLTMSWASPISVDAEKNASRTVTPLLHSTNRAWTSSSTNVQLNLQNPGTNFQPEGERGRRTLAVSVEGEFESFFKDKPSPLAEQPSTEGEEGQDGNDEQAEDKPVITRVIDKSPGSSRIILFGSNTFLTDTVLQMISAGMGTQYVNPLQLTANAVDWSLEDRGLLAIRGRTHFSRTLEPMERNARMFWEYLNYALALLGLVVVWLIRQAVNKRARARYRAVLAG